jgi:hypothetical protein
MTENDLPCDECGRFGAREMAGRVLCDDCIAQAGCGCAGHDDADESQ